MTDEERELHEIADDGCRDYAPFTMADIQEELEKKHARQKEYALEMLEEVTPVPTCACGYQGEGVETCPDDPENPHCGACCSEARRSPRHPIK